MTNNVALQIHIIPLADGDSELRRSETFNGLWELYRGDHLIRTLDRFESGFVNSTLFAVGQQLTFGNQPVKGGT